MSKQAAFAGLATLGGVVVIALVIAIAFAFGPRPAPQRLGYPSNVGAPAAGCQPVAPGAWSAICTTSAHPSKPSTGGQLDCRPVAPGAFTEICTPKR